MAHNLAKDRKSGEIAMFCVGDRQAAWHGLGQRIVDAPDWETAYRLAHLDYEVGTRQMISPGPVVNLAEMTRAEGCALTREQIIEAIQGAVKPVDSWGVFRNDTDGFLGAVSKMYVPIQNKDAFQFVDGIVATGKVRYESAGALGMGERIWVLARVDREIRPAGLNDTSECYLLFTTSHDGKGAAKCMLTTVRVVCQNTLQMALRGAKDFVAIPHVGNTVTRIDEAREVLGLAFVGFDEIEGKMTELARRAVTREQYGRIMQALFPFGRGEGGSSRMFKQAEQVSELFESNDGNAFPTIKGTALNLVNAYTEFVDHFRSSRRTESAETPNWKDEPLDVCRRRSAMFGVGADLKRQAFEKIWAMTKDSPRVGQAEAVSVAVDGFRDDVEALQRESEEARESALNRILKVAGFN